MNASRTMTVIVVVGVLLGLSGSARGAWIEQAKLTADDGAAEDYFGQSVSIDGDYAVVGAFQDDDAGAISGSAYIFERSGSTWTQQAKLTASDAASLDRFGAGVSITGDYAIVGADLDDDKGAESGSAYIFQRISSVWTEQPKLTASDGAAGDWFGGSVSISGNYAVVGAWGDDDGGDRSGSAYIFQRTGSTWTQQAKLTASDGAANDQFGVSVSIDGNYAVVGAHLDDPTGTDSGSAYIFERTGSTWTEVAKLTASDGAADDYFGYSVSISADWAIVGACGDDDNGSYSGSAYIFQREGDTWTEVAKLTASDAAADDYFGLSVSISGGYAVVGAYYDDDNGTDSGSAYLFQWTGATWTEVAKITASDGAASDYFGIGVSIDGGYAVIGAYASEGATGSAYIFTPEPASAVLLMLGLPMLLWRRRKTR